MLNPCLSVTQILRKMRRGYTVQTYLRIVDRIREVSFSGDGGWGLGRDIAGEMYVGAARRPVVCCFSIVDPTIRFRCELQYFYSPCSYLIKPRYLYLQALPDAAITGDVIVGFPGETEEQFQHTLDLMEKVKFDNLNTFRC